VAGPAGRGGAICFLSAQGPGKRGGAAGLAAGAWGQLIFQGNRADLPAANAHSHGCQQQARWRARLLNHPSPQRNLRIVVSLDTGRPELLAGRLAANPALLNKCAVAWWPGWGVASLAALAQARLKGVLAGPDGQSPCAPEPSDTVAAVARAALAMHTAAAARFGAAPAHFGALLTQYAAVLTTKRAQLLEQRAFLEVRGGLLGEWAAPRPLPQALPFVFALLALPKRAGTTGAFATRPAPTPRPPPQSGLSKLSEAAGRVDELSREAHAQRTQLTAKQAEADAALSHIQVRASGGGCRPLPAFAPCRRLRTAASNPCCPSAPTPKQASMEAAAERRREVEVLRRQLAEDEGALQERRGAWGFILPSDVWRKGPQLLPAPTPNILPPHHQGAWRSSWPRCSRSSTPRARRSAASAPTTSLKSAPCAWRPTRSGGCSPGRGQPYRGWAGRKTAGQRRAPPCRSVAKESGAEESGRPFNSTPASPPSLLPPPVKGTC
jgi:hypothetical protein